MKRRVVAVLVLAVLVVGARAEPAQWLDYSRTLASVVPPSLVHLLQGSDAVSTGSDGRLTMLLLGSDTRGAGIQRTDTIMVISLKGNSISAVSIPRDTARIPNPDGGTFSGRVNAILKQLKDGRTTSQALDKFKQVIESLLQVEIDYYALITFRGFESLVQQVEPITVKINREIKDTKFWDDPNKPSGVYFPESSNYDLYVYQPGSDVLCNGLWKTQPTPVASKYWCRRAMPFVRSRKGGGNSDFVRAKRQQDFVVAAIKRVLSRGSGSPLNSLVSAANGQAGAGALTTNIPINTGNAIDLYNRLDGATVNFQAVFSPPTYATHIPGGTAYELNLAAVRDAMKKWFGSSGAPPPTATPSPSPTPTLAPGETATPPPTLAPGQTPSPTPTPAPTLAPGETATPAPTLAPGETATPAPTLAPGETATPPPTLAPGETATPTAVGGLPREPTPAASSEPGGPNGPTAAPTPDGGAVVPGAPANAIDFTTLILTLVLIILAVGAALLGWRRLRVSR